MVGCMDLYGAMGHTPHSITGNLQPFKIIKVNELSFAHRLQESGVSVGDEGRQILGQRSKLRASHEELVPWVHEHGEGDDKPVALLAVSLEHKGSGS